MRSDMIGGKKKRIDPVRVGLFLEPGITDYCTKISNFLKLYSLKISL